MVRKETVEVLDDLDGTSGARPVQFGLAGKFYEMDLSEKNAAKLSKALSPYVAAGRRAGGRAVDGRAADSRRRDLQAVGTWAAANNIYVAERGRIAASTYEA
jgi:hypothetical protein